MISSCRSTSPLTLVQLPGDTWTRREGLDVLPVVVGFYRRDGQQGDSEMSHVVGAMFYAVNSIQRSRNCAALKSQNP